MRLIQSLKFRMMVFFTLFIAVLCTVLSIISVQSSINVATASFADHGIIIVKKAVELVDGDAFAALLRSSFRDMHSPFFVETQAALHDLKENSAVTFLYSMAPVSGSSYMFIIDGSDVIGGEDFSNFGDLDDVSDYDEAFFRCWNTREVVYSKPTEQGAWGWLVSIYAPILTSSGNMVGIMGCDFNAEALMAYIYTAIARQIIVGIIFAILNLVFMLFFLNLIFRRLSLITSRLKEISSDEGDLTRKIIIRRNDEIGEMGEFFNLTLEKIKRLVITIKNQTISLFSIGNDLATNMEQTAATTGKMHTHMQHIRSQVDGQSSSIKETNTTMELITGKITRLSDHILKQTESIAQSSSAIEEMLANIRSVTDTLVRNAGNVNELTTASEVGRTGLEGVSNDIKEIARESEGLLEINSVMQNIASQTNLLSMNAAIEAAHAGEAGKGFAVVADEIRKLAENSTDQSKIISDTLGKIKNSIDKITGSTNAVLDKFMAIDQQIRIVSDQERNIRNAMEEQGRGSQQILQAVGRMNELTQMVKDDSQEMLVESKEVIRESSNLETITQELSTGMNDMAAGVDQISNAVNRVNELSVDNKEYINTLVDEVSKFLVE